MNPRARLRGPQGCARSRWPRCIGWWTPRVERPDRPELRIVEPLPNPGLTVRQSIVEEVAFRGVIQGPLFGLLHLSPLVFPSHMLMGLCFGFLRNRSNSLYPGMLVHGGWNARVIYSEIAAH